MSQVNTRGHIIDSNHENGVLVRIYACGDRPDDDYILDKALFSRWSELRRGLGFALELSAENKYMAIRRDYEISPESLKVFGQMKDRKRK